MFSLTLICAAAVESVTLPKLAGLGPVLPGVAYKAGTAKTAFDFRGEAAGVDAPVCQSAELPPPCNLGLHCLIGLGRLGELVTQFLYEIKLTVINQQIEELEQNLKEAQASGNWDRQMQLLAYQPQLLQARNDLCKLLGNRVINV